MIASKLQRGPRWFSLISANRGASKGMAFSRLAAASSSFSSTNKNSAWGSTKRRISQGQATRSTLMFLRVIHFIFTSRRVKLRQIIDAYLNPPFHGGEFQPLPQQESRQVQESFLSTSLR